MWHTPQMQDDFQRMTYTQSADRQPTTSCDRLTRHPFVFIRLTRARIYTAIHILAVTCHRPNVWGAMPCSITASRRLFSATPELGRAPMLGGAKPVKRHEKTTYARTRCAPLFLNHLLQWSNTNTFNYFRINFTVYDTAVDFLRHRGGVITVPRWNFHSTTVEFLRYSGGI